MIYRILFISIITFSYSNLLSQTRENIELKIIEIEDLLNEKKFHLAVEKIDSILESNKSAYLLKLKGDAIVEYSERFTLDSVKLKRALECYENALNIDPNYYEALFSRGHVYFSHLHFNESINDFSKCIKISESKEEVKNALNSRALVFSYMKKINLAISDYKKVLEIDPKYDMTYSNLSMLFWEQKQLKKAENLILKAIEINDKEFKYKSNLALILLDQGKYTESEVLLEEILSENEEAEPYLLNNLGYTKMKLKKYKDAEKYISESLKRYPENSYAYRNLALLNIELGNINKACEYLNTSVNLKFTETYGNEVIELKEEYCK